MITIQALKLKIENNLIKDENYIFYGKSEEAKFLMFQYITTIAKNLNLEIEYQSTYNASDNIDIFDTSDTTLKVFVCSEFSEKPPTSKYYYIVADKIKNIDFDNVVEFPKLEDWQIQDYVYSNLEGINIKKLDYLCSICKFNINKLDQEIRRFKNFNKKELPYIFDDFATEGGYTLLSNKNIFDFSNAIIKKDYNTIIKLYPMIDIIDVEPIGLITILLNNFRDIITVQLANNPSPESCNMPANKFWAIRKNTCNIWSKEQLISNYKFLLSLDENIKTGKLNNDIILIDFILVNIL